MNTIDLVVLFLDLGLVAALAAKAIPAIRKEKMADQQRALAKAFAAFAETVRILVHEDKREVRSLEIWHASREEAEVRFASQQSALRQRRSVTVNGLHVGYKSLKSVSL